MNCYGTPFLLHVLLVKFNKIPLMLQHHAVHYSHKLAVFAESHGSGNTSGKYEQKVFD